MVSDRNVPQIAWGAIRCSCAKCALGFTHWSLCQWSLGSLAYGRWYFYFPSLLDATAGGAEMKLYLWAHFGGDDFDDVLSPEDLGTTEQK